MLRRLALGLLVLLFCTATALDVVAESQAQPTDSVTVPLGDVSPGIPCLGLCACHVGCQQATVTSTVIGGFPIVARPLLGSVPTLTGITLEVLPTPPKFCLT
jgi:hypothetical protein